MARVNRFLVTRPLFVCSLAMTVLVMLSMVPPSEGKELRVASWQPPSHPQVLATEAIEEFSKDRGVNVAWEVTPFSQYFDKLAVQVASKSAPDVAWITFGENDINLIVSGVLEPLDPFLQRLPASEQRDFDQGFLAQATMNGKLWYLPTVVSFMTWFYNRDMIANAGLKEPSLDWTWDDVVTYAKRLTRRTSETTEVFGFRLETWPLFWYEILHGFGGRLFSDSTLVPEKAVYNDDQGLLSFQYYTDFARTHQVAPLPGQSASFEQGTLAIWQNGSQQARMAKINYPNIDLGATLAPRNLTPVVGQSGGTGFGITSSSEQKDLAWEFIMKLSSRDVLAKIAANDTGVIVRHSVISQWRNTLNGRLWPDAAPYYRVVPVADFQNVAVGPIGAAISQALAGRSPREALDEAASRSTLALQEFRARQ